MIAAYAAAGWGIFFLYHAAALGRDPAREADRVIFNFFTDAKSRKSQRRKNFY
jgi:hypothetical protein